MERTVVLTAPRATVAGAVVATIAVAMIAAATTVEATTVVEEEAHLLVWGKSLSVQPQKVQSHLERDYIPTYSCLNPPTPNHFP